MRFSTLLLASLAIFSTSTHAATSLTQLLSASYIVDMTQVDTNTNTEMNTWRQYQSINVDAMSRVQTTVVTKQWQMQPFNQTIMYEQARLSGTGGSASDGPIYDYSASSWATSLNGARTWTSCAVNSMATRQPDYCSEITSDAKQTVACGRTNAQTCTISQIQCRHNNVIQPSTFYMLDSTTGAIVASMDKMDSTQITYWSNLIEKPTSGQFGDAVLLPSRTSCPDNNDKFPAAFGTAPVFSSATPAPTATPSSSTGPFNPRTSSTGGIQFGAASSSIPALSTIIMLLPAAVTAILRV